jgi:hypothetical protein
LNLQGLQPQPELLLPFLLLLQWGQWQQALF